MPPPSAGAATADADANILITAFTAHLSRRAHPKTLCPSEIARALSADELCALDVSSWRDLMPVLRAMAFEARERGEVEILQRGEVVGAPMADVSGPIRIRRRIDESV